LLEKEGRTKRAIWNLGRNNKKKRSKRGAAGEKYNEKESRRERDRKVRVDKVAV
jgi:hypothetical protein